MTFTVLKRCFFFVDFILDHFLNFSALTLAGCRLKCRQSTIDTGIDSLISPTLEVSSVLGESLFIAIISPWTGISSESVSSAGGALDFAIAETGPKYSKKGHCILHDEAGLILLALQGSHDSQGFPIG